MSDLYGSISLARDLHSNAFPAFIERDALLFGHHDSTWNLLRLEGRSIWQREEVLAWNGQKATV